MREVRNQARLNATGPQRLLATRKLLLELLGNVQRISSQAHQSETMLNEVCKDIRGLDHAKRHLSHEITVLKKLQALSTGVDQLKKHVAKRHYGMIANILEEVLMLGTEFQRYKTNLKVQTLTSAVQVISGDLKTQVHEEFRNYMPAGGTGSVMAGAELRDVCMVVHALGQDFFQEFTEWFVEQRLREYRIKFARESRGPRLALRGGDDKTGLDRADLRYDWILAELAVYDDAFRNVFPREWKMDERLVDEFCVQTRLALSGELEDTKARLDVVGLLKAISRTAEFEKEMSRRFPMENPQETEGGEEEEEQEEQETQTTPGETETYTVEEIKRKWQQKEAEIQARKEQKEQERQRTEPPRSKWRGIIGSCFDPYMDVYVAQEDSNMKEIYRNVTAESGDKKWSTEDEGGNDVLAGSAELIIYFNKAIKRCSKLTINEPLNDVHLLCKKYFTMYAKFLGSKVPESAPGTSGPTFGTNIFTNIMGAQTTQPPSPSMTATPAPVAPSALALDEHTLCLIINTTEYCASMSDSLARFLQEIIAQKFKENIDLTPEKAEFQNVLAKVVNALAAHVVSKLEPAFNTMVDVAQSSLEVVGDQSKYVLTIKSILTETAGQYLKWLTQPRYRYFCDVLVGVLIPRLYSTVLRARRYTETTSQQVLLDMMALKEALVRLPAETNERKAKAFGKLVTREMDRVEGVLKTLASPLESIVPTYVALVPNGSEADFSRLLDMKGVRYPDSSDLVDRYLATTNKKRAELSVAAGVAEGVAAVSSLFSNLTLPGNLVSAPFSTIRARLPGTRPTN
eukprot:TRINITY_DN3560_c0_g1_i5.p1 TRINITY_DN3560_c0_g1~~TRINITY_DN3560_c0_g1_i5.p1  ORF type:complete len:924 (-),score=285.79 TRINITY_DN3560_c0_g1_i5:57-2453(-)